MNICVKILSKMRTFIGDVSKNPTTYKENKKDFTRTRKLDFFNLSLVILGLLKKTYKLR